MLKLGEMYNINKLLFKLMVTAPLLLGGFAIVYGQNNALVINGAYIRVANGTFASPSYLVVNNGAPAAITRTTGHIISEQEGNFVRWVTSDVTATANYVFPFGFSNTDYLPVTIHKTSVGVGAGHVNNASSIDMSTWASINTNVTWATSVLTMTGIAGANATNAVVDRWWQVISLPAVTGTMDVNYRGAENTTIYPVGGFSGQEWDIPTSAWLPASGTGVGVTGAAIGTTTGITLTGMGMGISTPYILSATVAPLPIELVSFSASCEANKTHIKWTDASETNVSNIELQKSEDMNMWTTIYVAQPSNVSTTTNYSYVYNEEGSTTMYYRLKTNNNDGGSDLSAVIYYQPCTGAANTLSAFYFDNTLNVMSHFAEGEKVDYTLYDIAGNAVLKGEYNAAKGTQLLTFPVEELSNSIYIFRAESNTTTYSQKIIIAR